MKILILVFSVAFTHCGQVEEQFEGGTGKACSCNACQVSCNGITAGCKENEFCSNGKCINKFGNGIECIEGKNALLCWIAIHPATSVCKKDA